MLDTPLSLLERLRREPTNQAGWERLESLYRPFLTNWLRRVPGLQPADREDIAQQVLLVVVRRLREFEHSGNGGAFRAWLRAILANCLRDYRKKHRRAEQDDPLDTLLRNLEDPHNDLGTSWDEEHNRAIVGRLVRMVAEQFPGTGLQVFEQSVLQERPATEVAAQLGLTEAAVWQRKSRLLSWLREQAEGLID